MSDSDVGQLRKFGIRDLYNMYRSRGWKLPIMYVFENVLYDFTRGVSTHQYLQADELQIESANAKHSVLYMSSWTRVIRKSTRQAVSALNLPDGEPISLIDVGSGKGKVLLVWEEMYKDRIEFSILGVEFSLMLSAICKDNFKKVNAQNIKLYEGDVLDLPLQNLSSNVIFYMYNPFDLVLMDKFAQKVKSEMSENSNVMFIYNNSVHDQCFTNIGVKEIVNEKSWHPNGQYKIYRL